MFLMISYRIKSEYKCHDINIMEYKSKSEISNIQLLKTFKFIKPKMINK